jgi:hypothetical protein
MALPTKGRVIIDTTAGVNYGPRLLFLGLESLNGTEFT